MGQNQPEFESESSLLLPTKQPPQDKFHVAYTIHFILGAGYLLPWNAFITAVDYFSYVYPQVNVDRTFSLADMIPAFISLFLIVLYLHISNSYVRINVGLGVFFLSLLLVPVMDVVYIKGRVGLYDGFYVTVGAVSVCGIGDALVQGGLIGAAGELPERYMQAIIAGTAASGVLVSLLRIITKAVYSQDERGLRRSANLYFSVSIVVMGICIVLYNVVHKLPVVKYYTELKIKAMKEEKEGKGMGTRWRSTLWEIVGSVKWHGAGLLLIYLVTLSIFPGYITEDVYSPTLKDWYGIILITGFNVFDLVGKSLTAVYLPENEKVAVGGCFVRLLFFPLFYGCIRGPKFFRTEIPVTILTCLLGLTNGYLTSVLLIFAPKVVPLQHAETAGIVMVLFLFLGLTVGSVAAWFWVI